MTQEGQLTQAEQQKQQTIGDLLMKDSMTAKEQQKLAEKTDPTEQLKQNGIFSNGEEPDRFWEDQAALEPKKSTKAEAKKTVADQESVEAAPPPVQQLANGKENKGEDNPVADAQVSPKTSPDPKASVDSKPKTKEAK